MKLRLPAWATIVLGLGLFALLLEATPPLWQGGRFISHPPLASNVSFKAALLLVSLALMALDGRSLRDFGWRRPDIGARWKSGLAVGLGLGACASALIFATPAQGHPLLQGAGLGEIILAIWLWSSFTEEVFTRGLLQTWTKKGHLPSRLDSPVLASGLIFGLMHLSLLLVGADAWTVGILVVATTALGLVAGVYRQRTDSLLPPVLIHMAFNVGGLVGGGVFTLARKALGTALNSGTLS